MSPSLPFSFCLSASACFKYPKRYWRDRRDNILSAPTSRSLQTQNKTHFFIHLFNLWPKRLFLRLSPSWQAQSALFIWAFLTTHRFNGCHTSELRGDREKSGLVCEAVQQQCFLWVRLCKPLTCKNPWTDWKSEEQRKSKIQPLETSVLI